MSGPANEEFVTFMYVPGQSGNIRRFHLRRVQLRRASVAAVCVSVLFALLSVDYVVARSRMGELQRLRAETSTQRAQIEDFSLRMGAISTRLSKIDNFERKLRVITNLDPADPLPLPGIGGVEDGLISLGDAGWLSSERRHRRMLEIADSLSEAAESQEKSMGGLIDHLEDQTARLLATPSITPTKGWLTSSFGYRTSPFTGNREFHKGIDIAGRKGTPVLSPSNGTVRFTGHRRALGNTIVLRHGYGIETVYGHLAEIAVKNGQKVKRGDAIATMGTTGRSTGPHLHYQVTVNRKAVNPRNYILD